MWRSCGRVASKGQTEFRYFIGEERSEAVSNGRPLGQRKVRVKKICGAVDCWHDSILLALHAVCGDHTGVQYSNKGRTYVMNALVKISGSLETKVRNIKEAHT